MFSTPKGLKVLHKLFPEGIISGPVPASCQPSPPSSARRRPSPSTPQKRLPAASSALAMTPLPLGHKQRFTWEGASALARCTGHQMKGLQGELFLNDSGMSNWAGCRHQAGVLVSSARKLFRWPSSFCLKCSSALYMCVSVLLLQISSPYKRD